MLLLATNFYSQVGIGTTTPSAAAMLEVSSTSDAGTTYKGFMPPRVPNNAALLSINPSVDDIGLLVFVETTKCLKIWSGTDWQIVKCISPVIPPNWALLAIQDFEDFPASPILPYSKTGGARQTGIGLFPASPMYVSANHGYGVIKGTTTLIFGDVDASAHNSATFRMHLASFSTKNTDGADLLDTVIIAVSTDGGSTYSDEIMITGAGGLSNSRYDFDATGVVSVVYGGDNQLETVASAPGHDPAGYAKAEITGIPATANLKFKVTMKNNKTEEIWVIDDVEVFGN